MNANCSERPICLFSTMFAKSFDIVVCVWLGFFQFPWNFLNYMPLSRKNNHSIREISRLREFICVSHEMQSLQLNSDSCLAEIRRKLRNKFVNINHSDLPKYDSVRSTIDPRIRLAKQQGYTDIKFHRCTNNDDFEDILSVTKTWTCRLLISKIEKKDSLCVELK